MKRKQRDSLTIHSKLALEHVTRVAFALVAFAVERDRLYVAASLTVVAVLLLSFFHSQRAAIPHWARSSTFNQDLLT
jgi:hypothetical protein